ncbi:MAG: hypothetical protein Q9170_001936 [Blastenia crenularia]
MVKTSVLNDALNAINNAEKAGKRQVLIRPSSKVIVKFLSVMQRHGYIGEFEEVDDHRSGKIVIQLNGRINKTGVINPRYNVRIADFEKWVVKLLPSRQFGYIVLTTSSGIMDHEEARRKHVAGKIIVLNHVIPNILNVMPPIKRHSLHLDLPHAHTEERPQIAALFLTLFDAKAGYTIAWKRSSPALDITDSVEYKSLPSGLHDVEEDTVYFVHEDEYAGISSFINGKAEESERNALMLAVGALIPLSYGRLGKSWRHADRLRALARYALWLWILGMLLSCWYREMVKDPSKTSPLEDYWHEYECRDDEDAVRPPSGDGSPSVMREKRRRAKASPNGQPRTRNRAVSSASALAPPGQTLSTHHPALSLSTFLDTFGPLVFPLYRAALLRKRILLVGHAPVELTCNFVYNISVISSLPSSLHDLLPLSPLPTRLRPLFSVGVHDIPILSTGSRTSQPTEALSNEGQAYGWVACTTDGILGIKDHLYDTLITLPPSTSTQTQSKVWPRIQQRSTSLKATQRDARRYGGLRKDLRHYQSASSRPPSSSYPQPTRYSDVEDNDGTTPLVPLPSLEQATTTDREAISSSPSDDEQPILEPQSWSALAYNSFMWWASAGEKRTDLEEESEYDSSLLANLGPSDPHSPSMRRGSEGALGGGEMGGVGFEMAVIGYFHRFTTLILGTLSELIDAQDDEHAPISEYGGENERRGGEGGGKAESDEAVEITSDDMTKMGLDVWSESDRIFVEELVDFYWGRRADVKGGRVECCGVRVL